MGDRRLAAGAEADRVKDAVVTFDARTGKWRLVEPLIADAGDEQVCVPAGFTTDLASVPRAFWWLIAPFDLSLAAPIVHDWCYQKGRLMTRPITALPLAWDVGPVWRAEADRYLYLVAAAEGVPWWRRWLAWKAVRLFARRAWKGN